MLTLRVREYVGQGSWVGESQSVCWQSSVGVLG